MKDIQFFTPPKTATITQKPAASPSSSMVIEMETITPEIAAQILSGNTDNRPCRERHVKFLSDQMKAGAWQITGDPIRIASSGRLLDGQHRLQAIVLSGIPQPMYVARNCDEAIFSVLDTGRARTSSDVLATAGMKNYTAMSGAAKILLLHEHGSLGILNKSGRRETTNAAILDYCARHDLEGSTTHGHTWVKRCRLLSVSEWSALHYLLSQKDAELAYAFLQRISTGLNMTEGDPVFVLRTKLQAGRDGRFNFTPAERMGLVIKAWNAIREGRKVGQLMYRSHEEFPEIL